MTMELDLQMLHLEVLIRIDTVFRKHGIKYWLDQGTLLCAYRDGDLGKEHDADIGVFGSDEEKIKGISNEILSCKPWMLFHNERYHELRMQDWPIDNKSHKKYTPRVDMLRWFEHKDIMTFWNPHLPVTVPADTFDDLIEISFHKLSDHKFFAPKNIEQYIYSMYGEGWRESMSSPAWTKWVHDIKDKKIQRPTANIPNEKNLEFWSFMFTDSVANKICR